MTAIRLPEAKRHDNGGEVHIPPLNQLLLVLCFAKLTRNPIVDS